LDCTRDKAPVFYSKKLRYIWRCGGVEGFEGLGNKTIDNISNIKSIFTYCTSLQNDLAVLKNFGMKSRR
jgi:hypothetical protein